MEVVDSFAQPAINRVAAIIMNDILFVIVVFLLIDYSKIAQLEEPSD